MYALYSHPHITQDIRRMDMCVVRALHCYQYCMQYRERVHTYEYVAYGLSPAKRPAGHP